MIFFIARSNCLSSLPRPSLYIELSGCSILLRIRSSIPSSRDRRSTNLVALLTWLFSPPFSSFTSKWALDGLYLKLESLGFRRVETTSKRDHAPEWCSKRTNENAKLIITTIVGMVFEFFVGITLPLVSFTKINLPSGLISSLDVTMSDGKLFSGGRSPEDFGSRQFPKIYVPTNPHGAELLPPGIIVAETDFYLRRLWGEPSEDLKKKPKYLVTFTVGFEQRNNINAAVKKFSEDFQILLFHYDGRTTEWDQFEWSKDAIHISARKQTKWWYAKRFLHPDVVSAYEYIFIWDEDLGVEHFNADRYIELVKKHGLEISQPGLEPNNGLTWEMTKRRGDRDVHKETQEKPGWCSDPHLPPCAAFVEIMAPVFSREAWRCVWHMIQNDLVHGWGLDFALRRCVEPAHEKIGVVDSQWIIHQVIPSLGSQGESEKGKSPWQGVRERCRNEWTMFQNRVAEADKAYMEQHKVKE